MLEAKSSLCCITFLIFSLFSIGGQIYGADYLPFFAKEVVLKAYREDALVVFGFGRNAGVGAGVGLVLADFYCISSRFVDRGAKALALYADGVKNFAVVLPNYLHYRINNAGELQFGQPVNGLASVVVGHIGGNWPAGELGVVAGRGVGKTRPAFKADGAFGFVEADEAVAVGAFSLVASVFGVGVGMHGDGIAEAIQIVSGPGMGASGNRKVAGFFVQRMPPAAIDGVDDGRAGESERAVAVGFDAVLNDDG